MNHLNNAACSGMDQAPPILEDMINKILSLCNHMDNNNCLLAENTAYVKDILIRTVGTTDDYSTGGVPNITSSPEKDPTHITFRMRRALDQLNDALDKNYNLLIAQSRTINEFNQLA